jgi:hypothetical protein
MKTENLDQLMATHRWCYTIIETQDTTEYGGFVPSLVIEGVSGHRPMIGRGRLSAPWVWGKTLEAARTVCTTMNARLGLNEEDEAKIVSSTMHEAYA